MPAVYLGSKTLGDTIPTGSVAVAAVAADLSAQVAGALAAQASLTITPPTIAADLQTAADIIAGLHLAPPGIDFQLAAVAALLADIQARLSAIVAFQSLFGATVWVYGAASKLGSLGSDLQTAIGSGPPVGAPTDDAVAILIGANIPASRVALSAFVGVNLQGIQS